MKFYVNFELKLCIDLYDKTLLKERDDTTSSDNSLSYSNAFIQRIAS